MPTDTTSRAAKLEKQFAAWNKEYAKKWASLGIVVTQGNEEDTLGPLGADYSRKKASHLLDLEHFLSIDNKEELAHKFLMALQLWKEHAGEGSVSNSKKTIKYKAIDVESKALKCYMLYRGKNSTCAGNQPYYGNYRSSEDQAIAKSLEEDFSSMQSSTDNKYGQVRKAWENTGSVSQAIKQFQEKYAEEIFEFHAQKEFQQEHICRDCEEKKEPIIVVRGDTSAVSIEDLRKDLSEVFKTRLIRIRESVVNRWPAPALESNGTSERGRPFTFTGQEDNDCPLRALDASMPEGYKTSVQEALSKLYSKKMGHNIAYRQPVVPGRVWWAKSSISKVKYFQWCGRTFKSNVNALEKGYRNAYGITLVSFFPRGLPKKAKSPLRLAIKDKVVIDPMIYRRATLVRLLSLNRFFKRGRKNFRDFVCGDYDPTFRNVVEKALTEFFKAINLSRFNQAQLRILACSNLINRLSKTAEGKKSLVMKQARTALAEAQEAVAKEITSRMSLLPVSQRKNSKFSREVDWHIPQDMTSNTMDLSTGVKSSEGGRPVQDEESDADKCLTELRKKHSSKPRMVFQEFWQRYQHILVDDKESLQEVGEKQTCTVFENVENYQMHAVPIKNGEVAVFPIGVMGLHPMAPEQKGKARHHHRFRVIFGEPLTMSQKDFLNSFNKLNRSNSHTLNGLVYYLWNAVITLYYGCWPSTYEQNTTENSKSADNERDLGQQAQNEKSFAFHFGSYNQEVQEKIKKNSVSSREHFEDHSFLDCERGRKSFIAALGMLCGIGILGDVIGAFNHKAIEWDDQFHGRWCSWFFYGLRVVTNTIHKGFYWSQFLFFFYLCEVLRTIIPWLLVVPIVVVLFPFFLLYWSVFGRESGFTSAFSQFFFSIKCLINLLFVDILLTIVAMIPAFIARMITFFILEFEFTLRLALASSMAIIVTQFLQGYALTSGAVNSLMDNPLVVLALIGSACVGVFLAEYMTTLIAWVRFKIISGSKTSDEGSPVIWCNQKRYGSYSTVVWGLVASLVCGGLYYGLTHHLISLDWFGQIFSGQVNFAYCGVVAGACFLIGMVCLLASSSKVVELTKSETAVKDKSYGGSKAVLSEALRTIRPTFFIAGDRQGETVRLTHEMERELDRGEPFTSFSSESA